MSLSHVLWIGGATDSGKSSVAVALAKRHRLPVYHYDRADLRHHRRLAEGSPAYAAFLTAGMDERWVHSKAQDLFERSLQAFVDRFPLVVEDLLAFPQDMRVIAEGFGLTPRLVSPVLADPRHAIWLFPTDAFKEASMRRRGKGTFGGEVSDIGRATANLRERDRLLADRLRSEAIELGFTVIDVDGSENIDALAQRIAVHFGIAPGP